MFHLPDLLEYSATIPWSWCGALLLLTLPVLLYIVGCADPPPSDDKSGARNLSQSMSSRNKAAAKKAHAVAASASQSRGVRAKKGTTRKGASKGKLPPPAPSKQTQSSAKSSRPLVPSASKGKTVARKSTTGAVTKSASKMQPVKSSMSMVRGHCDSANSFVRVEPRKTEFQLGGSEENLISVIPAPDEP